MKTTVSKDCTQRDVGTFTVGKLYKCPDDSIIIAIDDTTGVVLHSGESGIVVSTTLSVSPILITNYPLFKGELQLKQH